MTETISAAAYISQKANPSKPNKYRNKRVKIGDLWFDSIKEANRYEELVLLQRAGEISHLELKPRFKLFSGTTPIAYPNGRQAVYTADFAYFSPEHNTRVVEDVKSKATKTQVYKLRKAILEAMHPLIKIIEV